MNTLFHKTITILFEELKGLKNTYNYYIQGDARKFTLCNLILVNKHN